MKKGSCVREKESLQADFLKPTFFCLVDMTENNKNGNQTSPQSIYQPSEHITRE